MENRPLKCMKTKKYLLIAILIVAAFLRLWKLGSIPYTLNPDETSLGYNAYSILKTGRDEHGKLMPIILKSFGDYKPGLYVYLTIPSVAIFGLNEFAARLPSALAGVLTVYLIFLIVRSLFTNHRSLSTFVAIVAATNPWLILFSRGAWEVNVSLTLTLLGIYFFLRALENSLFTVHCSLAFALTLITYQGAKLSTFVVVVLLIVLYWKDVLKIKAKYIFFGLLIAAIISSPVVLSFTKGQTGRLKVFSIFSYKDPGQYEKNLNHYLFHSESLFYKRGILSRFFNHFSGRFLFFEGDWSNPRHSAPNSGMLLIGDLAILLLGLIFIFRNYSLYAKPYTLILLWLIFASLPSILSRDQVHSVRALNMAVPLVIMIGFGYNFLFEKLHSWKHLIILLLFVPSFLYFCDSYFIHFAKHGTDLWNLGYKEVVGNVTRIQDRYKAIKVQQSFAQPYIYFLFYDAGGTFGPQKYDPAKYQRESKWIESEYKGDVGYVTHLDNIEFADINWPSGKNEHGTLFVADFLKISADDVKDQSLYKIIEEIKFPNGRDTAYRIVEVL